MVSGSVDGESVTISSVTESLAEGSTLASYALDELIVNDTTTTLGFSITTDAETQAVISFNLTDGNDDVVATATGTVYSGITGVTFAVSGLTSLEGYHLNLLSTDITVPITLTIGGKTSTAYYNNCTVTTSNSDLRVTSVEDGVVTYTISTVYNEGSDINVLLVSAASILGLDYSTSNEVNVTPTAVDGITYAMLTGMPTTSTTLTTGEVNTITTQYGASINVNADSTQFDGTTKTGTITLELVS